MLKTKIAGVIEKMNLIPGIKACSLVSRDGIMLGSSSSATFNESWFAAMTATLLASAESASVIIQTKAPDMVSIQSPDATLVIMGAGDKLLVCALFEPPVPDASIREDLSAVARHVSEVF